MILYIGCYGERSEGQSPKIAGFVRQQVVDEMKKRHSEEWQAWVADGDSLIVDGGCDVITIAELHIPDGVIMSALEGLYPNRVFEVQW